MLARELRLGLLERRRLRACMLLLLRQLLGGALHLALKEGKLLAPAFVLVLPRR